MKVIAYTPPIYVGIHRLPTLRWYNLPIFIVPPSPLPHLQHNNSLLKADVRPEIAKIYTIFFFQVRFQSTVSGGSSGKHRRFIPRA